MAWNIKKDLGIANAGKILEVGPDGLVSPSSEYYTKTASDEHLSDVLENNYYNIETAHNTFAEYKDVEELPEHVTEDDTKVIFRNRGKLYQVIKTSDSVATRIELSNDENEFVPISEITIKQSLSETRTLDFRARIFNFILSDDVTFASSNSNIFSVEKTGPKLCTITSGTTIGSARLIVTSVDDETVTLEIPVDVVDEIDRPTAIEFNETVIEKDTLDSNFSIFATITPETAANQTIYFESSDDEVVSIENVGDGECICSIEGPGEAVITATPEDNTNNVTPATCTITVTAPPKEELSVTLLPANFESAYPSNESNFTYDDNAKVKVGFTAKNVANFSNGNGIQFKKANAYIRNTEPLGDEIRSVVLTPNTNGTNNFAGKVYYSSSPITSLNDVAYQEIEQTTSAVTIEIPNDEQNKYNYLEIISNSTGARYLDSIVINFYGSPTRKEQPVLLMGGLLGAAGDQYTTAEIALQGDVDRKIHALNKHITDLAATIPTDVGDLTNNVGYISSLEGYATETYVDTAIRGILGDGNIAETFDTLEEIAAFLDAHDQDITNITNKVSASDLKTVNGISLLKSGNNTDIEIKSHHTFGNWDTTHTTADFCDSIVNDTTAIAGMSYLGTLYCSDLPGLIQGEAIVDIISNGANGKAIDITLTSVDTAPYRWTYSRAKVNSNWRETGWVGIQSSDSIATTSTLGLVKSTTLSNTVSGRDYAVEINSSTGTMKVNVPWTDTVYDDQNLREVAEGKTKAYVISAAADITGTKDANDQYTNVTAIIGVTIANLKVGDNIFIEALNVPDYWVSALNTTNNVVTSVSLSKLETTKVDLTTKQDTLIGSGTGQNIKTIDNTSILGSGNIDLLPKLPANAADGHYILAATKSNGTVTYEWIVDTMVRSGSSN